MGSSRKYRSLKPWDGIYYSIQERCNIKHSDGYKYYGARGIMNKLTKLDLEKMWAKYEADKMLRPSVDRIDKDKDYTVENCRIIELSENNRRASSKPIMQTDLDGNIMAIYRSRTEAVQQTRIPKHQIYDVINGKEKEVLGYIFKDFDSELDDLISKRAIAERLEKITKDNLGRFTHLKQLDQLIKELRGE